VAGQGMWRIRTNQELWEPNKDLDIVTDLKKKVEWIGHLVTMNRARINAKFTLEQATKVRGEKRYGSTVSLTSAIERGGWNAPVPNAIMEG